MKVSYYLALFVSCGLVAGTLDAARAQSVAEQLPAGTTLSTAPAGAVPVTNPLHSAAAPTSGVQMVKGVTGATTASTPGAVGEGGLPSLDHATPGNVAGLVSYCVHKKYTPGTTARSVGRALAKRDDVKSDQNYSLGGQGLLANDTSKPFDIATLSKSKRVMLCSDLVKKGQSLQ